MRIPRRPAWPVVFLLIYGIAGTAEPLESLDGEIARWRRIRGRLDPAAEDAFYRARAEATAQWVERWPEEELAWRERLRALERIEAASEDVAEALAGALRARKGQGRLQFPEDTRLLMARVGVRHGVRADEAAGWIAEALDDLSKALPRGDHPMIRVYRRERLSEARWRGAQILAEATFRVKDVSGLRVQLVTLTAESAVPVLDPGDRFAAAERARRRSTLFLWRARLARLEGEAERSAAYYRRAAEARPVTPGEGESTENAALLEEAARYAAGDLGKGTPVPPALRAAPHWLPAAHRLEHFEADGRPALAVVWDGVDPALSRALERLERNPAVRVLSFPGASAGWIQAVNPLYTAAQIWVTDAAGTVRLVGRFQPGGDGWEDAVTGAALRLQRQ